MTTATEASRPNHATVAIVAKTRSALGATSSSKTCVPRASQTGSDGLRLQCLAPSATLGNANGHGGQTDSLVVRRHVGARGCSIPRLELVPGRTGGFALSL